MADSLNALLGEVGYISFNEVVRAIHKHIGFNNDVEKAEQILMYILDKHFDKDSYGHDDIELYNKIGDVWQPFTTDPYSEWDNIVAYSPSHFSSERMESQKFYNHYEVLLEILKQRNEEKKLPF